MGSNSYFIDLPESVIADALEDWTWLPIAGKKPLRVTCFGDVFFKADDGIWFLDTLEGAIGLVCPTIKEFEDILGQESGQDQYLMGGLVDRAMSEGHILNDGECYDFVVSPVLGGEASFENMQRLDFSVATSISGQIHRQVKDLAEGTEISSIVLDGDKSQAKPWWKIW
ncbi:MAG: hypothetical protein SynsKO_44650 [Synoicihabitans sp.]